ncbi:MAG: hypothetical protein E7301_12515 [Butyrivibrio sp.]|nr:hypothetical protein [Butyrivibrio sp.]
MPKKLTNKEKLEQYLSQVVKSDSKDKNNQWVTHTNSFINLAVYAHNFVKSTENKDLYQSNLVEKAFGSLYDLLVEVEKNIGTREARKNTTLKGNDIERKIASLNFKFMTDAKFALVNPNTKDEDINAYVKLRNGIQETVTQELNAVKNADLDREFASTYEQINEDLTVLENIAKEADKRKGEKELEADPYKLIRTLYSQAHGMNEIELDKHSHLDMEIKKNLVRATREIMEFYQENLFTIRGRYDMDSMEKLQKLTNSVTNLLTENNSLLIEMEKKNPKAAKGFNAYIANSQKLVQEDINNLIQIKRYNDWKHWEDYKHGMQIELDTMMYLGKQELMEKNNLRTDDQFFFMVMMQLDKDRYEMFPHTKEVLDVLGISEDDVPAELKNDLVALKEKMMLATTTTIAHYVKETNKVTGKESTHYLNLKELDDLSKAYSDCLDGIKAFNEKLIANKDFESAGVQNRFNNLHTSLKKTNDALNTVITYIDGNVAEKEKKNELRPFSMYEIDGHINPEFGNNLNDKIDKISTLGIELVQGVDKNKKASKEVANQTAHIDEMVNAILRLNTNTIPNMMRGDKDNPSLFKPLTKDDIALYIREFQDASLKMHAVIKDCEDKKKAGKLTPQEEELYKAVVPVYSQLSQKYILLDYLSNPDNGDNELKRDIDIFNDAVSRKESLKNVTDNQIKFFNYVGTCQELMRKNQMFPQFLFEDPLSDRANNIIALEFTKQNKEAFEERARQISFVPWNPSGIKDLSDVEEYKIRNQQVGEEGQIVQYITKNDKAGFEAVLEKSLENLPYYLGDDVKKKIRDYYKSISEYDFANQHHVATIEQVSQHFDNPKEGGFLDAFTQEELDANYTILRTCVEEINANIINAGFNATARTVYDNNASIPNGYNLGKAYAVATNVFNLNNTAKIDMLSDATIPMAGGGAKQDQYASVTVGAVEKNYNVTSKLPKDGQTESEEFYTTTRNFRSSDFIDNMDMQENAPEIMENAKGKTEAEIKQMIDEKLKDLENPKRGPRKKFTNDLRSIDKFDTAENMAKMADLQVMHYLSGIRMISVHDLRIGFKTDANGNLTVSGISGANTVDSPFRNLSPQDEAKLIQPEDMLVMTEEMKEKVLRWDKEVPEYTPEEKEQFDQLPPESMRSFKNRVRKLANIIRESENYNFAEKDPVFNGQLYAYSSLTTVRGKIRVLKREDFKNLHIDDLAVGKNSVDYSNRDEGPLVNKNIFDVMADLPKACHDGLVDKWKAKWCFSNSKTLGVGVSAEDIASKDLAGFVPTGIMNMDTAFYNAEQKRFMDKCKRVTGKFMVMDNDRSKEYFVHWFFGGDTKKYTNVKKAGEKLDQAIVDTDKLKSLELLERKFPDQFKKDYPNEDERKQIRDQLKKYRDEVLFRAQQFAIEHNYIPPQHYYQIPDPIKESLKMYPVKDALVNYKSKLEVYLKKREGGRSSDFGNDRYDHMLGLYKDINDKLAEYAALTGDTSVMPKVAVLDANKKITFKDMFMSEKIYARNIPPHIRTTITKTISLQAMQNEIQPMQLYDAPANNNNKKKEINININKIDIDNVKAEPLMENDGNEIIIDEPKKSKVNKTNVNKIMKEQNIVINQKIIVNRDNKKSNIIENEIVKKQ